MGRATAICFLVLFGCADDTPGLRAQLRSLSVVRDSFGGRQPFLLGRAFVANNTPDTVAFAVTSRQSTDAFGSREPDPDSPGWFAFVLDTDTVRLTSWADAERGSTFMLLAPGDSDHVTLWTPAYEVPPLPSVEPGASFSIPAERGGLLEGAFERFSERIREIELVYVPNPKGHYPFRPHPFAEPDTLSLPVEKRLRLGAFWADSLVRFRKGASFVVGAR